MSIKPKDKRAHRREEELVPIKLDLRHDNQTLVDYFCWSTLSNDAAVEEFAVTMCADRRLPLEPWKALIAASIHDQLDEFKSQDKNFARTQHERLEIIK